MRFQLVFFCAVSFLLFSNLAQAKTNKEVEFCKQTLISAADKIQSISNQVPEKAFRKFIKNGSITQLGFSATFLGGGNPKEGARILFKSAKSVLDKNKKAVLRAAQACLGKCVEIRSLDRKCDEVNELTTVLNNLQISQAFEIAELISEHGGTDGVKRFVKREVASYYRDRQ